MKVIPLPTVRARISWLVIVISSEGNARGQHDLRSRWDHGLVACDKLGAGIVHLGIEQLGAVDVLLFAPEEGDVAPRSGERRTRAAEYRRDSLGEGIGGRELAQLCESRIEKSQRCAR